MPEPLNLFAPAARQKTKLRMALQGVSGGGKTLSALYIAYGMTGDWGKVALIDTEHDRALEYADQIAKQLDAAGFRVEVDSRNEKIGKKIREATLEKIPYMLVVGDRDMEAGTVSVRTRTGEDLGAMSLEDFTAKLKEVVDSKVIQ